MTLRQELRGWSLISVGALAIAGVFALLIAVSRMPFLKEVAPDFFQRGLIIHVIFSFFVWFLGVFGALLTYWKLRERGDGPDPLGGWIQGILAAGCLCLAIPGLFILGEPSLNNYIPVLTHPVYYAGLALVTVSLLLVVGRHLEVSTRKGQGFVDHVPGTRSMSVMFLVALICVMMALWQVDFALPAQHVNEALFWGGGHILQFLNTGLMICCWLLLAAWLVPDHKISKGMITAFFIALTLPVLPAPLIYLAFDVGDYRNGAMFTEVLRFGPLVAPVWASIVVGLHIWKHRPENALSHPAFVGILLSILTFHFGGFLGYLLDGSDTRVPAHYHGVIGGVNLSFMALFLTVIAQELGLKLGVSRWGKRLLTGQLWLYGVGQILHAGGLFVAGGYGAARKTAGAAQDLEHVAAQIAMYGMGIGALIAVIGGIIFVVMVGKPLLKRPPGDTALVETESHRFT